MKNQLKALTGIVALALAGQAYAVTDWTLASNYGVISGGVTVTAVANTNGTSTSSNGASQTIETGGSYVVNGFTNQAWNSSYGGIVNRDNIYSGRTDIDANEGPSPEHSIDNDGRYDMALLSFTSVVKLTQMRLGWFQTDADVTVMAYIGSGAPTLVGNTYSQLAAANSGWVLVGNYADLQNNATYTALNGSALAKPQYQQAINSNNVFSSYWLIGAYNPLVNGSTTGSMLTDSFDYVKLASVSGCVQGTTGCNPPSKVPEPGSLVLMGIGLLGLLRMRKATNA